MKAQNPKMERPVKVKTVGKLTCQQVEDMIWENATKGTPLPWEEILDNDTPEKDTETVFSTRAKRNRESTEERVLHQMTIPFPMDRYRKVLRNRTATEALEYCKSICKREGWEITWENLMVPLSQLNMELGY